METDDGIRSHIANQGLGNGVKGKGFWIGLTYGTDEKFYWANGDELIEDCSYTNWAPNEPNHKVKNGVTQRCVQLWSNRGFRWDDAFCYKKKSFICMKSVSPVDQGCTAYVSYQTTP
ncbi:C-type lectin domain family 18 member A-like [Glandiceps talaboti]